MPDGLLDCLQGQSHLAGTLCDMKSSDVKKLRPRGQATTLGAIITHPKMSEVTKKSDNFLIAVESYMKIR